MAFMANLVLRQVSHNDTDEIPALEPPPGEESNLHNPPTRQAATIAAMALFFVTATPSVILRMYTRIRVHNSVWWDDWTCVIALIGMYGFASIILESLKFGNGTDEWNVSKEHAAHFEELFKDIEVVARISIFFAKLSILLLYLRYFCPPRTQKNKIWWASWAIIIFNLLYCIALVLTVLLQCVGKPQIAGQTCINGYAVLVTASIINVVTDLAMLIIPIGAVWNLNMPRSKKFGIGIVFAFGSLAVASSVARLGYQIPEAHTKNRTILLTNVAILALAEHTIGIIVGCMPVLPSLYRFYFNPASSSRGTGSSRSRVIEAIASSPLNRSRNKPRRIYNDTTLLATENQELQDFDNGGHGNYVKVEGGKEEHIEMPERFRMDQSNTALVSQSVKVTSLPSVARER